MAYGSHEQANDIAAYFPATGAHRRMPTPGRRPPKSQHNPMAFDPRSGTTVVIVDRVLAHGATDKSPQVHAETWLYNLGEDAWTQLATATLPLAVGMNYNLAYDPGHEVLLLVRGGIRQPTAVWAMRLAGP